MSVSKMLYINLIIFEIIAVSIHHEQGLPVSWLTINFIVLIFVENVNFRAEYN